jgi:cell division protein FtsN
MQRKGRLTFDVLRLTALVLLAPVAANAQAADSVARPQQDSILTRAKQLSRDGRDSDGRKLIDSLLANLTPDSARYAEALYSRGAMAPTAADAERDYRRLLIEAPLSGRAEDAMLQLAQLEQARGDRRSASDHLQRYLLSYPQGKARARVSVQLVRLLFDQGPQQLARACDALRNAKLDVPTSDVELRNQLDAQAPRCAYVDSQTAAAATPVDSTAAAAPTAPPVDTAKPPVVAQPAAPTQNSVASPTTTAPASPTPAPVSPAPSAPAPPTSAPAAAAFYSVQLAAYDSQDAATRMVQQLVARGIDARVDGAKPPFRVRVGKFQTRADAAKASTDLKAKGHNGFITLVSPAK